MIATTYLALGNTNLEEQDKKLRRGDAEIARLYLVNGELPAVGARLKNADLARTMGVRRGAITPIVSDLLGEGLIVEGASGQAARGRKPTFLYIDSRRRAIAPSWF